MPVRQLLHPLVAGTVLLLAGAAACAWALLGGTGTGVLVLALVVGGAAAGFANSGST